MPHSPLLGARPFYFSSIFVDPANPDRTHQRRAHPFAEHRRRPHLSRNRDQTPDGIITRFGGPPTAGASSTAATKASSSLPTAARSFGSRTICRSRSRTTSGSTARCPNYRVCIGLQDDNSWCGPSAPPNGIGVMNRDWYQVGPGDGMWAWSIPRLRSRLVNVDELRYRPSLSVERAARSRPTTFRRMPSRTASTRRARSTTASIGTRPIAFTERRQSARRRQRLFESADRGETWSVISPDLTRNDQEQTARLGRSGFVRRIGCRNLRYDSLRRHHEARSRRSSGPRPTTGSCS